MARIPSKENESHAGADRAPEPSLPPVPVGLHRLLRLAAVDADFRERLIAQRDAAAAAAGVGLNASEKAILRAADAGQLLQLAERMPAPRPEQASRLRQIAANAVLLLGGAALLDGVACRKAEPAAPGEAPDAAMSAEAVPAPGRVPRADVAGSGGDAAEPAPDAAVEAAAAEGGSPPDAEDDAATLAAETSGVAAQDLAASDAAATAEGEGEEDAPPAGRETASPVALLANDLDEYCRRQEERLMQTGGGAAPDLPECYPPPDVSATLGAVAIDGPLAEEQVRTVLRRVTSVLPDLVRKAAAGVHNLPGDPCEDRRFRQQYDECPPVAAGEATVVLLVAPDGTVDGVRPQSVSALGDDWSEAARRFHGLRFPEADAPSQVTATWSLRPGR
ncbi:MAG: hypothetical protein HY907_21150 [Deltaproteobacteria bacterium]|nr:hypothetical protein [Deltaproteobacteria bacterium]